MKNQIEIGNYIRCTYEDETELYGKVLWVSHEQILIAIDSEGITTMVNATARSLEMIEIIEDGGHQ